MQDEPKPTEIIAAVARYLRAVIAPSTSGHLSFNAKVCANALEMSLRQLEGDSRAEHDRLAVLLGREGDLAELNAELCARIAAGSMDLETPGLADHLWAVTLAKLAVDQPTYWGYRAALQSFPSSPSMGEVPAPGSGQRPARGQAPRGEGVEGTPHPTRPSGPPSPSRGGREA